MNIPLVRKFELNLSDRLDSYSDTGDTENPRVGFGWEVVNGFRFRGNYAESFVAPQLTSYGDRSRGGLTSFSGYSNTSNSLTVPLSRFPLCASVPGVTVNTAAGTCTTNSVNGITQNGAPLDPQPGRGVGLNFGFDFAPVDTGLRISATYFTTKLINQITGTAVSNAINSDALKDNLQFFPAGMTAQDYANFTQGLPQSGNITTPSYYAVSVRQQNVLNLDIRGIDATADYEIPTETMGTFSVGGSISYFTKFDQKLKGGPWFSVLGSTGFNNTFPSIRTQARGDLGWEAGGFKIRGFANYVGEYHNWGSNTVKAVTSNANGNPNGGGDTVEANTLFDLNMSYSFDSGRIKGTQVYLNVDNIADKKPSFYNSASGVDSYGGNILGRVISVGFRSRF
jgi:iron complex outermembrane receptor protein